jgi:hypothetical protein
LKARLLSNAGRAISVAERVGEFAFGDIARGEEPLEVHGEQI